MSASESLGPLVSVLFYKVLENGDSVEMKDGDTVNQQEHLKATGTIRKRNTALNEIVALKNSQGPGEVGTATYDTALQFENFSWDLGTVSLNEGDTISVGGVSITGHEVLARVECATLADGKVRVAISRVESNQICR
jgi:hypothetical protein